MRPSSPHSAHLEVFMDVTAPRGDAAAPAVAGFAAALASGAAGPTRPQVWPRPAAVRRAAPTSAQSES